MMPRRLEHYGRNQPFTSSSAIPSRSAVPYNQPARSLINSQVQRTIAHPPRILDPLQGSQNKDNLETAQRFRHMQEALQRIDANPESNLTYYPFGKENSPIELVADSAKVNSQLDQTAKNLVQLLKMESNYVEIRIREYRMLLNSHINPNIQEMQGQTLAAKKASITFFEDKKDALLCAPCLLNLFAAAYNIFFDTSRILVARDASPDGANRLAIRYCYQQEEDLQYVYLNSDLDMILRNKLESRIKKNELSLAKLEEIFSENKVEEYLSVAKLITLRNMSQKVTSLKNLLAQPTEFQQTLKEISISLREIKSIYEQIIAYCQRGAEYPGYLSMLENPDFYEFRNQFALSLRRLAEQGFSQQRLYSLNNHFVKLYEETIKDTVINWPLMGRLVDGKISSFSKTLTYLVELLEKPVTLPVALKNEPPLSKIPLKDYLAGIEITEADDGVEILTNITSHPDFTEKQEHMSEEVKRLLNEFNTTLTNIKYLREQSEQFLSKANSQQNTRVSLTPTLPAREQLPFITAQYEDAMNANSKFAYKLRQAQINAETIADISKKLQAQSVKLTTLHAQIQTAKEQVEHAPRSGGI